MKYKLLLMFTHNNDITKVTKAVTILTYTKHTLDCLFVVLGKGGGEKGRE